ncbi:MAG: prepilin-type N-terminal cleavage/methylation domain-containing protein [Candidatus Aminicenantes bacterium]|nr:MAG: prepilin-type N-terminal cleavage/methylation domain-containing protein [Candidatus Aminicenantes bacterium]
MNSELREKGFTLIELIIVVTLIGILVGLGLPQFKNATKRTREATLKENLFIMRKLINQYLVDKGKYPQSLQTLVEEEYLFRIPIDPMTKSAETWVEIPQVMTMEEMTAGTMPGIMDVQSGSDDISTEGTIYNTW